MRELGAAERFRPRLPEVALRQTQEAARSEPGAEHPSELPVVILVGFLAELLRSVALRVRQRFRPLLPKLRVSTRVRNPRPAIRQARLDIENHRSRP